MILKAIAIDDEILALHKIERYCKQLEMVSLIRKIDNPADALYYLKHHKIDLIFLDIHMDGMSGIELLNQMESKPLVIMTTAFSQYSLKAFDLEVIDYLLKPIRFERFEKAVKKAFERKLLEEAYEGHFKDSNSDDRDYIFVKSGRKTHKVLIDEILYIEGMKDYLSISTFTRKYMVLKVFDDMLKDLPGDKFFRVHRSFIVALDKVDIHEANKLFINNREIPVGGTYKRKFEEVFLNHIRSKVK